MAINGMSKNEIKNYIEDKYGYDLSQSYDEIRLFYTYDESCQGTVPQAIIAFLESVDFECCLCLAVSLGGDSDTLTCIAGGIAEAFYKDIPGWIVVEMWNRLSVDFKMIIHKLNTGSNYSILPYIPTDILI